MAASFSGMNLKYLFVVKKVLKSGLIKQMQLLEFDELLRSWQVKLKKRDEPIAKKRPGPRKGQPMPNRWREGEPRGRIAELRAKEGKE